MPPSKHGVHKNPFLGWNPPAGDSAWAREEADRRGVPLSTILTEALQEYRAKHRAPAPAATPRSGTTARKPPAVALRPAHAPNCKCLTCRPKESKR